jgi:hypothetical protein
MEVIDQPRSVSNVGKSDATFLPVYRMQWVQMLASSRRANTESL